jgi:hypothetical protein
MAGDFAKFKAEMPLPNFFIYDSIEPPCESVRRCAKTFAEMILNQKLNQL